jgi:glycosyltransferase involved in cell wall biosynthesis
MDADLQDDPSEIPKFLEKIEQGYDVVSGWKSNRQDPLSKTLPSKLFNKMTAKLTGIPLHDFNCGFKAYRKEVLDGIKIYGELHRYIPVLAQELGYTNTEVSVKHNKREFGVSKYGWERYTRGLVDLLTVLATTRYLTKPGHLFGGLGVGAGLSGTLILGYLGILWFMGLGPIGTRPLFFIGILLVILSIQMISLGVLAELITRHNDSGPTDNVISEKQGFE